MFDISAGAAFLAGLVSFITPCVLPIVPPYLAYIAGVSFSELKGENTDGAVSRGVNRRVLYSSLAFVIGFTTVFVALGATASVLGQAMARYFDVLSKLAGVAILILGIHYIGLLRIPLLYKEARLDVKRSSSSLLGAYLIGLAFAFGWTPCVGPVLASVLFLAGSEGTAIQGAGLLLAYSAGMGLPFIFAGVFASRFLSISSRIKRHMALVEKFIGGLLVITGLLLISGSFSIIGFWLIEKFPIFATLG